MPHASAALGSSVPMDGPRLYDWDYGIHRTQDCVWIVTRGKLVVICVPTLQSVPLILVIKPVSNYT